MKGIECRRTTPEEIIRVVENSVKLYHENKYAFQVGLKDLDFDVDGDKLKVLGLTMPFQNIHQAEQALTNNVIQPVKFLEVDNTEHKVILFDYRPVGYSGFMDCVTHSLSLTDHGLFEVGRYQAFDSNSPNRNWQWFLHRRLATYREVFDYCETHNFTSSEFMQDVYQSLTDG